MEENVIKKNNFISYIKGFSIIMIVLIHLFEWGGLGQTKFYSYFRELLYPGIVFFILTSGSLIYIAYAKKEIKKSTFKLLKRGISLILIYYIFNLIKLVTYNFAKEPFYFDFINSDRMKDLINILTLKSSTVPITILFTIGIFLIISPIFLLIIKKTKYPKIFLSIILIFIILINYVIKIPNSFLIDFLYSKDIIIFPILTWVIPFILGIIISMFGFEKNKYILLSSTTLTIIFAIYFYLNNLPISPKWNLYPLGLYAISFSVFLMSLIISLLKLIQNKNFKFGNKILKLIEFLGDNTLSIYIIQWVVIDLTYLIFFPREWAVLVTIPILLGLYLFIKYKYEVVNLTKTQPESLKKLDK